jgi:hypothetical protein
MHTDTDYRHPLADTVDLDDPDALKRAVSLHQAGKAVFAIPFNAAGTGTLTWLDPRDAEREQAQAGTATGSLK